MKAFNLDEIEFYKFKSYERKAYRDLIHLRNLYNLKCIDIITFIDKVEEILFNEIPVKNIDYFKDGISYGAYSNIIKLLIKSIDNYSALTRLKIDILTVY